MEGRLLPDENSASQAPQSEDPKQPLLSPEELEQLRKDVEDLSGQ